MNKNKKKIKIVSDIYMFLVFLFLYIPIFALIVFSFSDSRSMGHIGAFTTKWYVRLFQNEAIMTALYYTVTIAIISSIIATIVGTLSAIGINKMRPRNKAIMMNVNNLPILNTEIVTGVALMSLFVFLQVDFGYMTMLIAHIMFCEFICIFTGRFWIYDNAYSAYNVLYSLCNTFSASQIKTDA